MASNYCQLNVILSIIQISVAQNTNEIVNFQDKINSFQTSCYLTLFSGDIE